MSDCRHEQIITYCYADTEEHAPLWACKQCGARFAPIKREIELEAQLAEAREAIREAYEVYAGSECFEPETTPEAYQQRLLKQMAEILGKALAGGEE